jgi:hypothetical protein
LYGYDFTGLDLVDFGDYRVVFVSAWKVVEEVLEGKYAEFLETGGV